MALPGAKVPASQTASPESPRPSSAERRRREDKEREVILRDHTASVRLPSFGADQRATVLSIKRLWSGRGGGGVVHLRTLWGGRVLSPPLPHPTPLSLAPGGVCQVLPLGPRHASARQWVARHHRASRPPLGWPPVSVLEAPCSDAQLLTFFGGGVS